MPTVPQQCDGKRMLPPVSLPMSSGDPPAAMIAAAPPLLPPHVRAASKGLLVRPYTMLSVSYASVSSGVFVLPIRIAPAARSRDTAVASAVGTNDARPAVPPVVMTPAVSRLSLMVTGTPWGGRRDATC